MALTLKVRFVTTDFIIKKLPYDLISLAGLAFFGKYLKSIKINSMIDSAYPVRSGVASSDILKSYLGQLFLGNNDFDAVEGHHHRAVILRSQPYAMMFSLQVSAREGRCHHQPPRTDRTSAGNPTPHATALSRIG